MWKIIDFLYLAPKISWVSTLARDADPVLQVSSGSVSCKIAGQQSLNYPPSFLFRHLKRLVRSLVYLPYLAGTPTHLGYSDLIISRELVPCPTPQNIDRCPHPDIFIKPARFLIYSHVSLGKNRHEKKTVQRNPKIIKINSKTTHKNKWRCVTRNPQWAIMAEGEGGPPQRWSPQWTQWEHRYATSRSLHLRVCQVHRRMRAMSLVTMRMGAVW